MCKLEEEIHCTGMSFRQHLSHPTYSGHGEKHWLCCQLLRGLLPSRSRVHGLYIPSPCMLVSLWSSLQGDTRYTFQFYFLWSHWVKQGEQRKFWGISYFVLRGSNSSFWWFLHSLASCWWRNWEVTPKPGFSSWKVWALLKLWATLFAYSQY